MRILLATLAVICIAADLNAGVDDHRPNVLLIVVDDLNDWIGCLGGHPHALTPSIDRLADRGILFRNAHCAAPACNPSRAALFSGRMPEKTGVWSNNSDRIQEMQPRLELIPQAFSRYGYKTLGTGKLLHSGRRELYDEFFSTEQRWSPFTRKTTNYAEQELPSKGSSDPRHVAEHRSRSYTLPLNRMPSDRSPDSGKGESFDWGPFDVPDDDFGDTRITNWALQYLKKEAESTNPVLLCIGYYRPHIPLYAPARHFERFKQNPAALPPAKEDDLEDLSASGRRWAREAVTAGKHATVVKHNQWRPAVEAYLACTSYVDHEIGRLVDALDRSTLSENTWIVLFADHGWHLGEKQHWGKWTGWERSTRVPLILVPPRKLAGRFARGGSRCDQPVGLIDVYPTLLEVCGLESTNAMDGQSLAPLLKEPEAKTGRYVITQFDPGNFSVRSERYRYLRYADCSEELYDLTEDPHEWLNLAGQNQFASVIAGFRQTIGQAR